MVFDASQCIKIFFINDFFISNRTTGEKVKDNKEIKNLFLRARNFSHYLKQNIYTHLCLPSD